MGLKNFFKKGKPEDEKKHGAPQMSEKDLVPPPSFDPSGQSTPRGPYGHGSSRPASIAPSTRSSWAQDIKHEVMVNYLFQQQCSFLWIGSGSGDTEGVLLRKSRGNYLACPPQLAQSTFGFACATLNVHVSISKVLKPAYADMPLSAQ